MNHLRDRLRSWLALEVDYLKLRAEFEMMQGMVNGLKDQVDLLSQELAEFKRALKVVSQPIRVVPRMTSFENSQEAALAEFYDPKKGVN